MENEKKEKVEVQKNSSSVDDVKCDYEGIKIIVDKNFIPKSLLSREDIKKFNYVLINLVAKFTNKANSQRDAISFKVYPLVAKNGNIRNYSGFKTNEFSELYRLNDDRQVSLIRNDLTSILLAMGKTPVIENMSIDFVRYARFITGISNVDGRRHYRIQVFISFNIVKTIFLSEADMLMISSLIKNNYVDPITFVEATSDINEDLSSSNDLL